MSLVSEDDIRKKWCVLYKYSSDGRLFPKETHCLFKCSIRFKHGRRWHSITGNNRGDCWQIFSSRRDGHAEVFMIRYIESKIKEKEKDRNTRIRECEIEVAINYSPCKECSQALISLKRSLENKKIDVNLEITFASFYGCKRAGSSLKNNCIPGLVELLQNDIELDVFDRDTWGWLLYDVLCLKKSRKFRYIVDEDDRNEREEREDIDDEILQCLLKIKDKVVDKIYRLEHSEKTKWLTKLTEMVKSETCEDAKKSADDSFRYLKKCFSKHEEEISVISCRLKTIVF